MKRLGALVAAVAMVAGALWVRSRIDDSGGGGGDDALPPGEAPALVCATELADVCDRLDADTTVEDAGATADRLAAGEPLGADGWLVVQPWPEMVGVTATAGGGRAPALDVGDVLARSPAVIAMWRDREAALIAGCQADAVDWACLGAAAGDPWADHGGQAGWGEVRVAHPDPDQAGGLTVLAGAVAGFLGDSSYATNDLDDDRFGSWFAGLEGEVGDALRAGGSPLGRMLTQGRAAFAAVGGLESEVGRAVAAAARRDELAVLYPAPMVTADVVLATVPGAPGAGPLTDLLGGEDAATALSDAGWRVEGRPPAPGVAGGELPAGSGLPGAGVLVALRERAGEALR